MKINKKGYSNLVIVFMMTTFISLILFAMLLTSYLDAKRLSQIVNSKRAYYSAEAAMSQTVQTLRDTPGWLSNETFDIVGAEVERTVEDQSPQCPMKVDLNAKYKNSKRKISVCFEVQESDVLPLDVMVVIDRSGSMDWKDGDGKTALDYAKGAAKKFVDILHTKAFNEDISHKVGVVSFNNKAREKIGLTQVKGSNGKNKVRSAINNIGEGGSTNIAEAIYKAKKELDDNARPEGESIKIIVLLSDGVPQHSQRSCSGCRSNECLCSDRGCNPNNNHNYAPQSSDGGYEGNCCTNDAVFQAQEAKDKDYIFFSIHLENYKNSACGKSKLNSTKTLGRLLLLRCSNEAPLKELPGVNDNYTFYKETDKMEELEKIYEEVASSITLPTFGTIKEEAPDPDNP